MQVLNAMSGESTESPQKSEELQEMVDPSPYTQGSDKLLKQTEASGTDSNIDTAKGPTHIGMITNAGDTTKRHVQDTNITEFLVNREVVQNDNVGDYVGESATLQKDSPDLRDYGAKNDYSTDTIKTTTLQNDSLGLHDYSTKTVQRTTLQKDSLGLDDSGTNTIQRTTLQKESPVLHNYGSGFGESIKFQKNSLIPSHDVVLGGDSQMELQKSDVSKYKMDSFSTDPKAGPENKVPSSTEGYYGRSVSVQMCSSLATQSSLRGNISHSSSTGHSPTSDVQLRRDSREQFSSDVATISDKAQSTNTPTTKEHTLPNPWHSQESSKGPHLTSLDKNRSYEEDTRWEAALWSGAQRCGSFGHNQRCRCQNKNSKKQHSGSPEELHPASSLPVSHSYLKDISVAQGQIWFETFSPSSPSQDEFKISCYLPMLVQSLNHGVKVNTLYVMVCISSVK